MQVDELAEQAHRLGLSHPELDFDSHDALKRLSLRFATSGIYLYSAHWMVANLRVHGQILLELL